MNLYHYSAEPFVFDPQRVYIQSDTMKPVGLWLSVEDDTDPYGWKQWCEREEWNTEGLAHRTEIVLTDNANVLVIAHPINLDQFTRKYARPTKYHLEAIDWTRLAQEYDGLIIAPYQWSKRLDMDKLWYYGWDCASGCIWNCAAINNTVLEPL